MSHYKNKYIHWKAKYLNLKNKLQTNTPIQIHTQIGGWSTWFKSSDTSNNQDTSQQTNTNSDSDVDSDDNTQQTQEISNQDHKTEPGRGILGDALYYFVANTGIDGKKQAPNTAWTYKEPQIQSIKPDLVTYTDINQELLEKLYNHSRSEYEEGFDIGYIVGYECGCNQETSPEKKNPPGNIDNPQFVKGFIEGFGLAFQKGTRYYYTTWIQINNNNNIYKKKLIDFVTNGSVVQDEDIYINKSDPNYDPIEEKSYDDYYVYLKKKIMGKKHSF
jgi:hypothetical protein